MSRRTRDRAEHASDVGVGLTTLLQLRVTVGALAVIVLAGSAFATGRMTGACTVPAPVPTTTAPPTATSSPVPLVAGFPHSDAGAAQAAAEFATILFGNRVTDRAAYREAVSAIATSSARTHLLQRADQAVDAVNRSLHLTAAGERRLVVRTVPLSWHVVTDDGTTVRVRIWALGIVAVDGRVGLTVAWSTGDYVVTWTDAGWRLVDDSSVTPLVPRSPQAPTATTAIAPELGVFTEYGSAFPH